MPSGAVPFPFGNCLICKDRATGVHYGVATCEGCKGFFKRSIVKAEKYKCFFGGHCEITPQTRNRCKSCRYKLCLQSGMSFEAVKMGRIPKLKKERALKEYVSKNGLSSWKPESMEMQSHASGSDRSADILGNGVDFSMFRHGQDFQGDDNMDESPSVQPSPNMAPADSSQKINGSNTWNHGNQKYEEEFSEVKFSKDKSQNEVNGQTPNDLKFQIVMKELSLVDSSFDSFVPSSLQSSAEDSRSSFLDLNGQKGKYTPSMIKVLIEKVIETSQEGQSRDSSGESIKEDYTPSQSDSQQNDSNDKSGSMYSDDDITDNAAEDMRKTSSDDFNGDMNEDSGPLSSSSSEDKPINNLLHYSFLENYPPVPIYEKIPLHVTNERDLEKVKNMGILPILQEDPYDMISSVAKGLNALMDSFGTHIILEGNGMHMSKETTKLMHMTLQKLIPQIQQFLMPLQLKRNYIRSYLDKKIEVQSTTTHPDDMPVIWQSLMKSVEHFNEIIIGYCTSTPGFKNLAKDLQEHLLKNAYFGIWMLTSAEFLFNGESHLVLPDGRLYSRATLSHILKEATVKSLFDVAEKLNRFHLCDLEFCILCIIQLTASDMIDPEEFGNLESLQLLHSHYIDILMMVISRNRRTRSSQTLSGIFQLLPFMSKVTGMIQTQVTNFSVDNIPSEDELQELASQAKEV